jgi:GAF domain-containing protein
MGERVVVDDVFENPHWEPSAWADRAGLRSYAALPIKRGRKVIGAFAVFRTGVRPFQKDDLEMLDILSSYASIALEKILLIEEGRQRASRLEIVDEIAKAVGSALEPEKLFQTIVQEIRRAVPCERCIVASINPVSKLSHIWHIFSEIKSKNGVSWKDFGIAETVYQNIYETKSSINIRDTELYNFPWARRYQSAGIRSALWIPILQNNRCVAHITLNHREPNAFTSEHEKLLSGIAGHMGSAIRNTILFQEAEARSSRLETVKNIAKTIGSELDPSAVFENIYHEIQKIVPYDRCAFAILGPRGLEYQPYLSLSGKTVNISEKNLKAREKWILANQYKKQKLINFSDLSKEGPVWIKPWTKAGLKSWISVPIIQDNKSVAHFSLMSKQIAAFAEDHENLLVELASHLGPAIRNAHLYEQSRNYASRMEIVDKIAKAIGSTLEPDELFRIIVHEIRNAVPCDRCAIATVDPLSYRRRYWHIESDFHIPAPTPAEEIEAGKKLFHHIYKPKESLLINTPTKKDPWDHLAKNGVKSSLVIPILLDNTCVAHIALSSLTPNSFSIEHEELLFAVAAHLGPAMVNATLFQTSEDRASRLEIVGKIAKAVGSELEPDELFKTIINEIQETVPCDRIVIGTLDSETGIIQSFHEYLDIPQEAIPDGVPERGLLARELGKSKSLLNIPDLTEGMWSES